MRLKSRCEPAESDGDLTITATGKIDISSLGDQNGGGLYSHEEAGSYATVDDLQSDFHFCDES